MSARGADELDEEATPPPALARSAAPRRGRRRRARWRRARRGGPACRADGRADEPERERGIGGERRRVGEGDLPVEGADALAEILVVRAFVADVRRRAREDQLARAGDDARVRGSSRHEGLDHRAEICSSEAPSSAPTRRRYPIARAIASCSSKVRRSLRRPACACRRLRTARETRPRGDLLRLARDEHAHAHELGDVRRSPARPRGPARDVEIAEAARAALHVGLEQIDRAAEAAVPLGGFDLRGGA